MLLYYCLVKGVRSSDKMLPRAKHIKKDLSQGDCLKLKLEQGCVVHIKDT